MKRVHVYDDWRFFPSRMGRWTCLFAILMALIPLGEVYGESMIVGYDQDYTQFYYSSDTGPVSHTGVDTSGYADAATQTLRAYASAEANAGEGKVSSIYSFFSNTLTVNPGTSELSAGDPVTLRLAISLDGNFSAGDGPVPYLSLVPIGYSEGPSVYHLSTVDAWAVYRITDPNRFIEGEGLIREELVEFGYDADIEYDSMSWEYIDATYSYLYPWWITLYDPDHDGRTELYESWGWSLDSNTGASLGDSYSFWSEGSRVVAPIMYGPAFDTGLQTITFQTYVGAQLDIEASMDIFPQAYTKGDWATSHGLGDFMNTFGAGITSPYVSGIELSYAISPVQPIPEPCTLLLVGSGLAGLIGFGRKRLFKRL